MSKRKSWGNNPNPFHSLQVSDAPYPDLKVPGLDPGALPPFSLSDYPATLRKELDQIAAYERELLLKLHSAPTYLLFQS